MCICKYIYAIPPKIDQYVLWMLARRTMGPCQPHLDMFCLCEHWWALNWFCFMWALDMFCFCLVDGLYAEQVPQSALQQIPAARQEYLACKQTEALRCRPTSLGCDACADRIWARRRSLPLSWIGSNPSNPWWTSKFDQWSVCLPSHAAFCHMAVCGSPASQN